MEAEPCVKSARTRASPLSDLAGVGVRHGEERGAALTENAVLRVVLAAEGAGAVGTAARGEELVEERAREDIKRPPSKCSLHWSAVRRWTKAETVRKEAEQAAAKGWGAKEAKEGREARIAEDRRRGSRTAAFNEVKQSHPTPGPALTGLTLQLCPLLANPSACGGAGGERALSGAQQEPCPCTLSPKPYTPHPRDAHPHHHLVVAAAGRVP